jgi:hypothetical protein
MSAFPPKADIGRAPGGGFLLGSLPALIFHFAAIETHSSNARLPRRCVKRNDAEVNLVSKSNLGHGLIHWGKREILQFSNLI